MQIWKGFRDEIISMIDIFVYAEDGTASDACFCAAVVAYFALRSWLLNWVQSEQEKTTGFFRAWTNDSYENRKRYDDCSGNKTDLIF